MRIELSVGEDWRTDESFNNPGPLQFFDEPEFFDADFWTSLTIAKEILNCINEALKIIFYVVIIDLNSFSGITPNNSNGIIFMEGKMVVPMQLRAPIMMRLLKDNSGMFQKGNLLETTLRSVHYSKF